MKMPNVISYLCHLQISNEPTWVCWVFFYFLLMKEKWKHLYILGPAHTSEKTENLNYLNLSSSQLIKNA